MLNLNSILLSTEDPKKLLEFYTKVFGKKPDFSMEKEGFYGFMIGQTMLGLMRHDKIKGKNKDASRLMFNLETKEIDDEFKRIKATGAKVVAKLYEYEPASNGPRIATFADPDGNYFQLMTPVEM